MEESPTIEPTRDRIIDAEDENIRRMFAQVQVQADITTTSQARTHNSLALPIRFRMGA